MPQHFRDQVPFDEFHRRMFHFIEQGEERLLQTNHTVSSLGAVGILDTQILLGPVLTFRPVHFKVRHLFGPKLIRSAVCPHQGLGTLIQDGEIVPFPKLSASWDLTERHEDDQFLVFDRCELVHKAGLVMRHKAHLRHLATVMHNLISGTPTIPQPFSEYAMKANEFPSMTAEEHAAALDDLLKLLARLLATRHLRDKRADEPPPATGEDGLH